MDTEQAILTAVIATPDDDLPRLVYADWLEENGQAERAEFIRASVYDPSEWRGKYKSQFHLPVAMREHRPHVYIDHQWPFALFVIRRGFIEEVYCTRYEWLDGFGPSIVRSHPIKKVIAIDVNADRQDHVSDVLIWWARSQPYPAKLHLSPVSADLTTA